MLTRIIADALPRLMRDRVLDAVLAAQSEVGGPVTSQQARASKREPVMRHTRAFTDVAGQIVLLGADDRGRVLHSVGTDRHGAALWWVETRGG